MRVLLWMGFQAGLTGFFLYQETLSASQAGRTSEPLPVFILSTFGALAFAALVNGMAEHTRVRRRREGKRASVVTELIIPAARVRRKQADVSGSNDNQNRSRPTA